MLNTSLSTQQRAQQSPLLYQRMQLLALDSYNLEAEIAEKLNENITLELDVESSPSFAGSESEFDVLANFSQQQSLSERLLSQLDLEDLTSEELAWGQLIISNLDERGFFSSDVNRLAIPPMVLNKLLKIINYFNPIGCAVANTYQSLAVQINAEGYFNLNEEQLKALLPLVKQRDYQQIALLLNLNINQVDDLIHYLKSLTPYPGLQFSHSLPQYIKGDLLLEFIDNQPVVKLLKSYNLKISESFSGNAANINGELKEQLKDAKNFINILAQREQTLLKVGYALALTQKDYFLYGKHFLKSLTMQQLGGQLNLHEATVSRAVSGKY